MLQELIEGPLLNPKRMEEAIRAAKFIRRLMSFFHPFSHRFSEIPKIKVCSSPYSCNGTFLTFFQSNLRWARLGCSLLTTLLASPDGMRFLSTEDQFLTQIVKSFAQLDPVRPFSNAVLLVLILSSSMVLPRPRSNILKKESG